MMNEIKTDLAVIGGGLTGCIAAIAARRTSPDMEVWLIEKNGFLGGMATAGYVFPFMSYFTRDKVSGKWKRLSGGIFKEILDRAHELGYTEKWAFHEDFYTRFDPIMMRYVLDTMVLEAGVNVLFHSIVNKVESTQGTDGSKRITELYIQTKMGEIRLFPSIVIDSTGDADIIFHAGGDFKIGRESDGLTQPATTNFRMGNVGLFNATSPEIKRLITKYKSAGNPLTPRDDCLMFYAGAKERHFNQTRVAGYDFTDPFDLTKAEIEGRTQAHNFIQFLRKKVRGFKKSKVMSMGTQIGVRESRRIIGEYILTEKDILNCVKFDERIGLGNYPVDIHDPQGSAKTQIIRIPQGDWYTIPFRSLIPKNISNVLVAGRPISADHVAHSAIRIMPICAVMGHAAGVAAGIKLSKYSEKGFKEIPIQEIQNELRSQKAILE